MRRLFLLILLLLPIDGLQAQQNDGNKSPLNQTNKKGDRQGMWLLQQPERMGEDPYSEFGNYLDGRKYGVWYRMNNFGDVLAIERYKNNVLDGEVKYFEQGRLVCTGNYLGLNPNHDFDTIYVMNPITQTEKLTIIPTDRGTLKHGTWRYYDAESGRMIREEEWSVDELVARKDFSITKFDSVYYEQRLKKMPHNQKHISQPTNVRRSLTH